MDFISINYTKFGEGMIDRCYNPNNCKFHRYGGRGVRVCEEWRHNPKMFYDWAISKWKPGLRLDKDKFAPNKTGILYSPEYCCFLTPKENSMYRKNSRIIEYNGESMCVAQWADKIGITYMTFMSRLKYGWGIEKILTHPVDKKLTRNEYK